VHSGKCPRVLLAPDSYKGTLRASEIVEVLAGPFETAGWEVDRCPVADGGEGTAEALLGALGGETVEVDVHDPLGRRLRASFVLLGDGDVAVVETAAASGLSLLTAEERDPESASTRGTGELIVVAAQRARRILVGVGGSASTDGGLGAVQVIEQSGGIGDARLICLCDVRIPWEQAAPVFAPQKGADASTVTRLSARMQGLAAALPRDPRGVPMTGAAGGLAGGLWAGCGAELVRGAPFILDAVDFDGRLQRARTVVTGEGLLDETTVAGKAVSEVARRATRLGVPVHAIVRADVTEEAQRRVIGLASVHRASTPARIARIARRLAAELGVA